VTSAGDYRSLGGNGPLTFAHRGGAGLWPENTLQAFKGAIELGCSHLETDLRMARDGEIVLLHDARLERTTNGTGVVGDYTVQELKRLDAGYHFSPDGTSYPFRGKGHVIPTFAELVASDPKVAFNVEIKEHGEADLPRALWEFIQRHNLADRIIVAAEQHALLGEFRQLSGTRVATSASRRECWEFLIASRLGLVGMLNVRYQALQIPVTAGRWTLLTPRLLAAAHRVGVAVHVWTIDEVAEMRRLLDLGVDGLMTDYPDRLMAVVSGRARASGR
jgi:glycerophosphoryl diester phosphodiesterase